MKFDIIFYTHASKDTGFGHASRCAKLAIILNKLDPTLRLGFFGDFSNKSKTLIENICKFKLSFTRNLDTFLVIYDRMDDVKKPEIYSKRRINYILSKNLKLIFLASGNIKPDLNDNVIIIGYKINELIKSNVNLYWGLKFSPVYWPKIRKKKTKINHFEALIALGGGFTSTDINRLLLTLINMKKITSIKVLLSPVNKDFNLKKIFDDKDIVLLKNIEDLQSTFQNSDLILCSYGHLTYEVMSLGKATCVFAKKDFQKQYADLLENKNLCISAGKIHKLSNTDLIKECSKALKKKITLETNTKKLINKNGLKNIAKILLSEVYRQKGLKK